MLQKFESAVAMASRGRALHGQWQDRQSKGLGIEASELQNAKTKKRIQCAIWHKYDTTITAKGRVVVILYIISTG